MLKILNHWRDSLPVYILMITEPLTSWHYVDWKTDSVLSNCSLGVKLNLEQKQWHQRIISLCLLSNHSLRYCQALWYLWKEKATEVSSQNRNAFSKIAVGKVVYFETPISKSSFVSLDVGHYLEEVKFPHIWPTLSYGIWEDAVWAGHANYF